VNVSDLFDHPAAHAAADDLAELNDRVAIQPHGPASWHLTLWNRPACPECQGRGYDPERGPTRCPGNRCPKCEGTGRETGADYYPTGEIILHADGRRELYHHEAA
jgi:hypothetical protein